MHRTYEDGGTTGAEKEPAARRGVIKPSSITREGVKRLDVSNGDGTNSKAGGIGNAAVERACTRAACAGKCRTAARNAEGNTGASGIEVQAAIRGKDRMACRKPDGRRGALSALAAKRSERRGGRGTDWRSTIRERENGVDTTGDNIVVTGASSAITGVTGGVGNIGTDEGGVATGGRSNRRIKR